MKKNYNPLLSKFLMCAFALTTSYCGFAQSGVGIGTTTPQAALDVTSTTGGFLPPRMSFEQREKLTPLVAGLIIYQEDNTPGLYLYNGTTWTPLRGDDLGNHNVTQRLNLQNQLLVGADDEASTPGTSGLRVNGSGQVGVGTNKPTSLLQIGDKYYNKPSFLRMSAGDGTAHREWDLGVNVNTTSTSDISGENYDFTIRDATDNKTRLLIDYKNGNMGLGTDAPTEKLHVNGKVKVSESVEAEQFKYTTAKTHMLAVPPSAFVSCEPDLYRVKLHPTAPINPDGEIILPLGISITGLSREDAGYLLAPVNLPQFATITELTLIVEQVDRVVGPIHVVLFATPSTTVANPALSARASIKFTITEKVKVVSTSVNHIVRNDLYMYQIMATMNSGNSKLIGARIRGVIIKYTVSQPD